MGGVTMNRSINPMSAQNQYVDQYENLENEGTEAAEYSRQYS